MKKLLNIITISLLLTACCTTRDIKRESVKVIDDQQRYMELLLNGSISVDDYIFLNKSYCELKNIENNGK